MPGVKGFPTTGPRRWSILDITVIFFHNIDYQTVLTVSWDLWFEKKMHTGVSWQWQHLHMQAAFKFLDRWIYRILACKFGNIVALSLGKMQSPRIYRSPQGWLYARLKWWETHSVCSITTIYFPRYLFTWYPGSADSFSNSETNPLK